MKQNFYYLMILSFFLGSCLKQNPADSLKVLGKVNLPDTSYKLSWSDEFNGSSVDTSKWNYWFLGKWRDAYNDSNMIRLDGVGHLVIEIQHHGDSVFTGMLNTNGKFAQKYGYFEVRAKLPTVSGQWSAFWLLSNQFGDTDSEKLNPAELDIYEYMVDGVYNSLSSTVWLGGYGPGLTRLAHGGVSTYGIANGFHTFGLEWTPNKYIFNVDGYKTLEVDSAVSQVPEYVILSIEIQKSIAGPISLNALPDSLVVDYVRVYKKKD